MPLNSKLQPAVWRQDHINAMNMKMVQPDVVNTGFIFTCEIVWGKVQYKMQLAMVEQITHEKNPPNPKHHIMDILMGFFQEIKYLTSTKAEYYSDSYLFLILDL